MTIFSPDKRPLQVAVLVLRQASLMSLAATLEPMRATNRVIGRQVFAWRLVSVDGRNVAASCGLPLAVDGAFDPAQVGDALMIVAAFDAMTQADRALLQRIRAVAARGIFIAGIEAGAWILAKSGLLSGRRATTHWEDLEEFATLFPAIEVVPDRYIVDAQFGTMGGAAPTLDFMLALIRARVGIAVALDVASIFIYDEVRAGSDAQPSVSLGAAGDREPRLARAIKIMEERLEAPLTVAAIASRLGLSVRTLELLFKHRLDCSPGSYYLTLRLNAARRMLVDARLRLAEVAARTGFASSATLSRACRRHFGMPPSELRRKAAG